MEHKNRVYDEGVVMDPVGCRETAMEAWMDRFEVGYFEIGFITTGE